MTRPRLVLVAALAAGLAAAGVTTTMVLRKSRAGRTTSAELRREIAALEQERNTLLARRSALVNNDVRLAGMPDTAIKVGIPTSLTGDLIEAVLGGFANHVSVELSNIRYAKKGTVRRVVTLGTWDLLLTVDRVTGRLSPGTPGLAFGGDAVSVKLPVTLASGSGQATVRFVWDGRHVAGAMCGDMDVTQPVQGSVVPATYTLTGTLTLSATGTHVLVVPRFRPMTIHVTVKPSAHSWAAAQKLIDDRRGVCGFVLDRADILGSVRTIVDRGFDVRLPLERIRPMAFPVGFEPAIEVHGRHVALRGRMGKLSITDQVIWLGADVAVKISPSPAPSPRRNQP
jgi:hypothetical protein